MTDNLDKQHLAHSRRIVESADFKQDFRALVKSYPILVELYIAIKHDLCGYAHLNTNSYKNVYWRDTKPLYGIPTFSVTYTFDSSSVYLSSITVIDE